MTENTKVAHFHIPRRSEMVPALPNGKKGKADAKPYIDRLLDDDKVIAAIEKYKTNGGATGHWRIDDIRVMDIILEADKAKGNGISATGLSQADILAAVNVVLRRRYDIVDHKIVGLSPKWMLTAPVSKGTE